MQLIENMDRYDSHLCMLSGAWHRLPISCLALGVFNTLSSPWLWLAATSFPELAEYFA